MHATGGTEKKNNAFGCKDMRLGNGRSIALSLCRVGHTSTQHEYYCKTKDGPSSACEDGESSSTNSLLGLFIRAAANDRRIASTWWRELRAHRVTLPTPPPAHSGYDVKRCHPLKPRKSCVGNCVLHGVGFSSVQLFGNTETQTSLHSLLNTCPHLPQLTQGMMSKDVIP